MNAVVWILIAILIVAVLAAAALWSRGRRRGGVIATPTAVRSNRKDAGA